MNDEEIDNLIHQMIFGIPKDDNKSIISAYGGIDMDDLTATIRRLKKVPDINDLMKENKKLTNNWNELEKDINNQLMMTRKFDDYNEGYFDATLHYYNKMKEIKEKHSDKGGTK